MANSMMNVDIKNSVLYEYLGCHVKHQSDGYVCTFRLYAPNAVNVYLAGDHNGWATDESMMKISDGGIWEYVLKTQVSPHGMKYKYFLEDEKDRRFIADIYARMYEAGGEEASMIYEDKPFLWEDRLWLERRRDTVKGAEHEFFSHPMNIYEIHIPSWKRKNGCYLNYREAADELAPYVKQLGCTHVSIFTGNSHTNLGRFAPDAKLGTPEDFKYFVNKLHSAGIGVILDLVPVYYGDDGKAEQGPYAENFLISNALFRLCEYHLDGFKVTAHPDASSDLIKALCDAVSRKAPDTFVVSETGIGEGFDLIYNKEWTRQTLDYITVDPLFRKGNHSKLIAPAASAFRTRHILPFSHRHMSGGNRSLLDKSYGSYDMKFAGTRLLRAYQMTFPGKKLSFMSTEFGPFKEWDKDCELEWFMLDFERHRQLLDYTAALGNFYLSEPALWERDFSCEGFEWIYPDMAELNIIAYRRISASGAELIVLLNFSPVDREGFTVINMKHTRYKEVFSSDAARFGGTNKTNPGVLDTIPVHDGTRSLKLTLPGLSAVILKPITPF